MPMPNESSSKFSFSDDNLLQSTPTNWVQTRASLGVLVPTKDTLHVKLEKAHTRIQARRYNLRSLKCDYVSTRKGGKGVSVRPPIMLKERGVWTCHAIRFCPWCWARQNATMIYRGLELTFYPGGGKELGPADKQWRPVLAVHTKIDDADYFDTFIERVSDVRVLRRNMKIVGGNASSITVEPFGESADAVKYRYAEVLLWPAGDCSPPAVAPEGDRSAKVEIIRPTTLEKKDLASLAATAGRYPKGLIYGDVTAAARIIGQLQNNRVRQFAMVGRLKEAAAEARRVSRQETVGPVNMFAAESKPATRTRTTPPAANPSVAKPSSAKRDKKPEKTYQQLRDRLVALEAEEKTLAVSTNPGALERYNAVTDELEVVHREIMVFG